MKIIVTTTYEGVDDEWLNWYCDELEKSGVPHQIRSGRALRKLEPYSFSSNDPTDFRKKATTSYEVVK